MRVLLVSHACAVPINRGKLAALAARPGLDLSVLVPRFWRERGQAFATRSGEEEGYRIYSGGIFFPGRIGGHFYRSGLIRALRGARPDLVHLEEEPWSLSSAQVMAMTALLQPRPALVVFTWENLDLDFPWYYRAIERRALVRADILLAGGVTSRERLLRLGADPGRVEVLCQFGLDPEIFTPPAAGERPGGFTVGFVGRLVRLKGVDLLIRALAALGGEWRAIIVGDGDERASLEGLAASLGIGDRIEFTGWVDQHDVPAHIRRMDAMVFPSRTTPTWAEQFGHPLIEAMSCGAVPVGSDSAEIPHVIGEEGLVFPEEDAPALTDALRRLRDEPGLRERLAAAGRRRILREFTWEVLAEKTHALYERAVERGGRG